MMKADPKAYSAGFINPTDPFPAAMRAAFTFEKKAAATAHGADVPAIPKISPSGSVTLGINTT